MTPSPAGRSGSGLGRCASAPSWPATPLDVRQPTPSPSRMHVAETTREAGRSVRCRVPPSPRHRLRGSGVDCGRRNTSESRRRKSGSPQAWPTPAKSSGRADHTLVARAFPATPRKPVCVATARRLLHCRFYRIAHAATMHAHLRHADTPLPRPHDASPVPRQRWASASTRRRRPRDRRQATARWQAIVTNGTAVQQANGTPCQRVRPEATSSPGLTLAEFRRSVAERSRHGLQRPSPSVPPSW